MMNLNKILSFFVSKLLHRNYTIDTDVSNRSLIIISLERFFMLLRGLKYKCINCNINGFLFVGKNVKISHLHLLNIKGTATLKRGVYINALSKDGITIGNNFTLGENSIIECSGVVRSLGESLHIGDNVGISANAFFGVRGRVEIGDYTIIGPNFYLHSENHLFSRNDIPIKEQGESRKGIIIGSNCWIGSNVVVLDGVEIGDGVVIGAGSVVTKNIPDYKIVAGVPAREIGDRKNG